MLQLDKAEVMPRHVVTVLGGVRWTENGHRRPFEGARRRVLLGLLLLHAPRPVSLERISAALWPSRPTATATGAAYVQLHRLRQVLPPVKDTERLVKDPAGYALVVQDLDLDVVTFRERVASAVSRAGDPDCRSDAASAAAVAVDLRAALAVWAGPPLVDAGPDVAQWPEIVDLLAMRRRTWAALADLELAHGRHDHVLNDLELAVRTHPDDEHLRGQMIRALYLAGRQAQALAAYRDHRQWSVEILGQEPGPRLRALHNAVLRHDSELLGDRTRVAAVGTDHAVHHRGVLVRAADLAESLGGYRHAAECLSAALVTAAPDDPERSRLLLRLASCRLRETGAGHHEVAEARSVFHAGAGPADQVGLLEADLIDARIAWCAADHGAASRALAQIRDRLTGLARDALPLSVTASVAGLLAVTGGAALALDLVAAVPLVTRRQGTPWERARLLCARGVARLHRGDIKAIDDLRAATVLHERSQGWTDVQFLVNLMDAVADGGDLRQFSAVLERASATARARSSSLDLRYLAVSRAWGEHWSGRSERATALVGRWLAGDTGHSMGDAALCLHVRLFTAAGDLHRASGAADRLTARTACGTGRFGPVAAIAVAALLLRRQRSVALVAPLVEQALSQLAGRLLPAELGVDLPLTMRGCGLADSALGDVAPSPWRTAALHALRGEWRAAAAVYRTIGSVPDAAQCDRHC